MTLAFVKMKVFFKQWMIVLKNSLSLCLPTFNFFSASFLLPDSCKLIEINFHKMKSNDCEGAISARCSHGRVKRSLTQCGAPRCVCGHQKNLWWWRGGFWAVRELCGSASVFIRQSILAVIIKEHQLGCTCYQLRHAQREGKRLLRRHSLSCYICTREKFANAACHGGQGVGNKSARNLHAYSLKLRSFKKPLCFN